MDVILHKLCERSQQELWDVLNAGKWSKEHAETAFYLTEILKATKKMEHLKKLDEAMERYEEEESKEPWHNYARRRMPSSYEYEEDEDEGAMVHKRGLHPKDFPPYRWKGDWKEPPINYAKEDYYEEKYKELLEEKWEKEKDKKDTKLIPTPK